MSGSVVNDALPTDTVPESEPLSDSLGRYVLAIYELAVGNRVARSKDIADLVGVSRPSVTGALQKLAKQGFIEYEPYGYVVLTEAGESEARQILLKHRALYDFLVRILGLPDERAEHVSTDIEQHIPGDVLCRLVQFNKFYRDNEDFRYRWTPQCQNLCQVLYGVEGGSRNCLPLLEPEEKISP